MKPILITLFVVLIPLFLTGCRTVPVHNVERSGVPPGLSAEQVGRVIQYAAVRRGWSIEADESGYVVASILVRGRHRASVDIAYDANSFSIRYRDSENLLYDGERIHRNYNRWVLNLERTIRKELLRAAGRPVSGAVPLGEGIHPQIPAT